MKHRGGYLRALRGASGVLAVGVTLLLAGCFQDKEQQAATFNESGLALIEAGDWDKAELEFRNAIKAVPRDAVAHYNMGLINLRKQEIKRAADHLFTALDTNPEYFDANLKFAEVMLAAGDVDAAQKHADRALELQPDNIDAKAMRAVALFRSGEQADATALATEVANEDPANVLAGSILVAAARQDGDDDKAMGLLDSFIANNSDNPENAYSLSMLKLAMLQRQGDEQAFISFLKQAVDRFPDDLSLRRSLAIWHARNGDTAAARTQLAAMSDSAPDDATIAMALVRYIGAVEGAAAARAELVKRIEASTDPTRLRLALASIDYQSGAQDAAKQSLRTMISEFEGDDVNLARAALARYAAQENDAAAAQALVDEILADEPKNVEGLALSAALKLAEGDTEGSILAVREALNEEPNRAGLLRLAVRAYSAAGRTQLAIDSMSAAVEASNYATQDTLIYAAALRRQGSVDAAEVILAEGARRNPTDRSLLLQLAQVRLELGQWSGAEEAAALLRQLDENDTTAARIVAASLSGQERFEESIEILSGVVAEDDATPQSMAQLVRTLMSAGEADAAIAALNEALASDPGDVAALVLKSGVLESQGDLAGAEAALQAALAAAPTSNAAFLNLSNFYARNDRSDDAIAIAQQGVDQATEPGAVGIQLAGLLERRAEFDAAIDALEKLHAAEPDSIVAANNLASMLADHRGDDPAVVARALEIAQPLRNSAIPAFQDTYGWLLYLNGDYGSAIEKLLPAVEALPNNPWVQYHIGMTYAKLGETEQARTHLTRAVELGGVAGFARRNEAQEALDGLASGQ